MNEKKSVDYEIRVAEAVSSQWCDWFAGMRVEPGLDETGKRPVSILYLTDPDTAVLHGVLATIGSMNMTLLSVAQVKQNDEQL